jgi:hypothetical protein
MSKREAAPVIPRPEWDTPTVMWVDIIDRYIHFIQVPTWRASARHNHAEPSPCVSADASASLGGKMRRVLERMAGRRALAAIECKATAGDLEELTGFLGRHVPRTERCPSKLHWHFQRAFLFNAAGYACTYCRRTAWSVYAEETGEEPRRTLRFEIDHRITRRRLTDPARFDLANLVVACRSCNTIKAEMTEHRFVRELESLASAVHRGQIVR